MFRRETSPGPARRGWKRQTAGSLAQLDPCLGVRQGRPEPEADGTRIVRCCEFGRGCARSVGQRILIANPCTAMIGMGERGMRGCNRAKYDGDRDMMQKRAASDSNDLPRRGCWETLIQTSDARTYVQYQNSIELRGSIESQL